MDGQYGLPHIGGKLISEDLVSELIMQMRNGDYSHSDCLPTESVLAEKYHVSRTVIRDALSSLEREGFVVRRRGVGTLINKNIVNKMHRFDLKFQYNKLVEEKGLSSSADMVKWWTELADYALSEKLGISMGERVVVFQKRILASDVPVIFSVGRLPGKFFESIDLEKLDWVRPIYSILEDYCHITVETEAVNIRPINASKDVCQLLQVPEGEALLYVDEVGYYNSTFPVMHTTAYYTNYFDFAMFRKKL